MEEAILEREEISLAKKNVEAYFNSHDVQYVTEDAVFTSMNTGEETHGREAIGQMLNYFYHVAFDAKAEITNKVITEKKAVFEFNFKGKHIGEFDGMQPTNKEVNVPTCVSYDLENGLIKKGRIYMLVDVMMKQLQ
jgi:predicted ester cyclase